MSVNILSANFLCVVNAVNTLLKFCLGIVIKIMTLLGLPVWLSSKQKATAIWCIELTGNCLKYYAGTVQKNVLLCNLGTKI